MSNLATRSEQPAHPDRTFHGVNMSARTGLDLRSVRDFRSDLIRADPAGDTDWSEWRWQGTHDGGSPLDMAGVIVCGVRDSLLTWARLMSSRFASVAARRAQ